MSRPIGTAYPEVGGILKVYPHEVLGGGSPALGSTVDNGGSTPRESRHYWVNGNVGLDTNDGLSPDAPFKTMDKAFDTIGSGDVIHFNGNTTEQLSTPLGIFDVTIIGEGNLPRHADAHTTNNGYSGATWKAGSSASTPNLIIRNQGWRLINILFDGPASAAAVQVLRTNTSGDNEVDASHVHILSCRFVAAQNHIEFKGGPNWCVVENNLFYGATGDSLAETTGDGVGTNSWHRILNNYFVDNDTHIDVGLSYGLVRNNVFGAFTTTSVDVSGGTAGKNVVTGNYMTGDYDAKYVAHADDEWAGNYSMDVTSAEVGAEGLTIAIPVA